MIDEDEEYPITKYHKYHEDMPSFLKYIFQDVTKLCSDFTCNPFKQDDLTRINDTSVCFDPTVMADIKFLELNGEQQFEPFCNVSDVIKK